jgi:hypothetical protein
MCNVTLRCAREITLPLKKGLKSTFSQCVFVDLIIQHLKPRGALRV